MIRSDLPRNTIDISHIVKSAVSTQKTQLEQNMDKFCELLDKIMKARENESDMSDEEEDDNNSYRRKDAEKNLKFVTKNIEKEKAVEMVSEKQRIKRGKVRAIYFDAQTFDKHKHDEKFDI